MGEWKEGGLRGTKKWKAFLSHVKPLPPKKVFISSKNTTELF